MDTAFNINYNNNNSKFKYHFRIIEAESPESAISRWENSHYGLFLISNYFIRLLKENGFNDAKIVAEEHDFSYNISLVCSLK
jgi:hypothetical protein